MSGFPKQRAGEISKCKSQDFAPTCPFKISPDDMESLVSEAVEFLGTINGGHGYEKI